MSADPLSDVLRTVRLTGATFFEVAATAPWAAEQPPREVVLPKVLPGGQHLVSYHVVTEGSCYAARIGEPPIPVEAGEVVVFTRGDAHVMSSAPGLRAEPTSSQRSLPARCRSSPATAVGTACRRPSWSAASSPAMPIRSIR